MSATIDVDSVKRVFAQSFAVRDIAEPLASFDVETPAGTVQRAMRDGGLAFAGVRSAGWLTGFVGVDALKEGSCGQFQQPLDCVPMLAESASLLTVIVELKQAPLVLVSAFGQPAGVIQQADLQKAPVRMWLFGLVTLIEMRFTELIRRNCPAELWQSQLSPGRLRKTEELWAFRREKNHDVQLLDCLQFADKAQLVARNENLRNLTVFNSRRHADDVTRKLEQLRNHLAHAQDILVCDWDTIIELCEFLAR